MTTKHHRVHLSRGILDLTYQSDSFALDELLDFAERINPKRAFLFVSKVLGRHIPVAPSSMRAAFETLAHQIPDHLPEPILVVGMAETAVGLSAGVHQTLQKRYPNALLLNSTRHAQNAPLLTTFSEEHSHASTHLIYQSDDDVINEQLLASKTLIMVDDEASTGKTCQNLITALIQAGLSHIQQVHLATLVDWSLAQSTPPLFDDVAFYRHHLLCGSWQWTTTNDTTVTMPDVATTKAGSQPIYPLPSWGRTPTLDSTTGIDSLWQALPFSPDEFVSKKVLVLGSNEFVWLAFLVAERLEQKGALVKFASLTRSPIAQGTAIRHRLSFYDNYRLGMTNFVYNVDFDEWDLVALCIETPLDSVDELWQHSKVAIISPFCSVSPLEKL